MRYLILLTGILLLFTGRLVAQDDNIPSSEDSMAVYQGLFSHEEPLYLTLKTDLKKFRRDRRKDTYQDAEMMCQVNENFQVTHPARIKARGIWRLDNCSYPPFWLNIRYSGLDLDTISDLDIRRIKMAIRCRPTAQYKNYILREYMVYKIYNLLTPYSFRARLVKLKFIDTSKDDNVTEDWAFMIEPVDLMAARLDGVEVESDVLTIRTVNREIMSMTALFAYMIGNGDISVTGRHNLKILTVKPPGPPGFIPIPYDFDYTGLVNTHYAIPQDNLGISSVRERYYLGPCRPDIEQQEAVDKFATYRDRIIEYIMGFELLDLKEREEMVAYIESYFTEASDPRFVDRKLTPTCR